MTLAIYWIADRITPYLWWRHCSLLSLPANSGPSSLKHHAQNRVTDVLCFPALWQLRISKRQLSCWQSCLTSLGYQNVYRFINHQVSCMCLEPLTSQCGMGSDISPSLLEIHDKSNLAFLRSRLWLDGFKIVHFWLRKTQQQLKGLRYLTSKIKFTFYKATVSTTENSTWNTFCCTVTMCFPITKPLSTATSWMEKIVAEQEYTALVSHNSYAGWRARGPQLASVLGETTS